MPQKPKCTLIINRKNNNFIATLAVRRQKLPIYMYDLPESKLLHCLTLFRRTHSIDECVATIVGVALYGMLISILLLLLLLRRQQVLQPATTTAPTLASAPMPTTTTPIPTPNPIPGLELFPCRAIVVLPGSAEWHRCHFVCHRNLLQPLQLRSKHFQPTHPQALLLTSNVILAVRKS